jgi:hypothetical protein
MSPLTDTRPEVPPAIIEALRAIHMGGLERESGRLEIANATDLIRDALEQQRLAGGKQRDALWELAAWEQANRPDEFLNPPPLGREGGAT